MEDNSEEAKVLIGRNNSNDDSTIPITLGLKKHKRESEDGILIMLSGDTNDDLNLLNPYRFNVGLPYFWRC